MQHGGVLALIAPLVTCARLRRPVGSRRYQHEVVLAANELDARKAAGRLACDGSSPFRSGMVSRLDETLRVFDATESNLDKLDRLWSEMEKIIPDGIAFGSPQEDRYAECLRAFREILKVMPKLDGWTMRDELLGLNEIAQMRLDAKEVDEPGALLGVEDAIDAPRRALREYRSRLQRTRRRLIRTAVQHQLGDVDNLLAKIGRAVTPRKKPSTSLDGPLWAELRARVAQIHTLVGSAIPQNVVWKDFQRHLGFAMVCDFKDITEREWPYLKAEIETRLFHEDEPLPVGVADLGARAAANPSGRVATQVAWSKLTDDAFERLIFLLLSESPGYENVQWLTRTRASDRGRDLSAYRVHADPLSGALRSRVIVQIGADGVRL